MASLPYIPEPRQVNYLVLLFKPCRTVVKSRRTESERFLVAVFTRSLFIKFIKIIDSLFSHERWQTCSFLIYIVILTNDKLMTSFYLFVYVVVYAIDKAALLIMNNANYFKIISRIYIG